MRYLSLLVLTAAAWSQELHLKPLFEVASVRPSDPNQQWADFRIQPGGRLHIANVTLQMMIEQAFDIKRDQISGGPGWLATDHFDIEAKAEGDPDRRQLMEMLRALLIERFELKAHRENRPGTVFALVVNKGGPKFKTSIAPETHLKHQRNTPPELEGVSYTIVAEKVSMALFVKRLAAELAKPVVDQTGLAGDYDFKLDYNVGERADAGESIFTALSEQLGLKVQPTKGTAEFLIIESAQRPSRN